MKLPRDVSGNDLIKALKKLGYHVTRQAGSHIRLTLSGTLEHHVTIPNHDPIKVGTLSGILSDIALHLGMSKDELIHKTFY